MGTHDPLVILIFHLFSDFFLKRKSNPSVPLIIPKVVPMRLHVIIVLTPTLLLLLVVVVVVVVVLVVAAGVSSRSKGTFASPPLNSAM